MGDGEIAVLKLDDSGDVRGSSFPVPPDWFAEPFPCGTHTSQRCCQATRAEITSMWIATRS
jgi:hypothetical protein